MENYQIKVVSRKKLLFMEESRQLYYRKGILYYYKENQLTAKLRLKMSRMKFMMSKLRITERLLRLEPRLAMPLDKERILLSYHGHMWEYCVADNTLTDIHKYRENVNNPLNVLKIKNADGMDEILYGEYWGNGKHEDVCVYGMKNHEWEKKYSFPEGTIKHIHALIEDKYRDCVLILTGDEDRESGIWIARNNFKDVVPWVLGKQMYRSCVAFPVQEGLIYATDSPLTQNAIYLLKLNGAVEKLYDLPGPCIYGTELIERDGCVSYAFATSVEGDSRYTGWRYRLSYRLGEGVKDRYTHLIKGNLEKGFSEICSFKKDMLPMLLFQFGNMQFPVKGQKRLLITPVSVRKYDGKTVELEDKTDEN